MERLSRASSAVATVAGSISTGVDAIDAEVSTELRAINDNERLASNLKSQVGRFS